MNPAKKITKKAISKALTGIKIDEIRDVFGYKVRIEFIHSMRAHVGCNVAQSYVIIKAADNYRGGLCDWSGTKDIAIEFLYSKINNVPFKNGKALMI